ncbi:hypothetical protein BRC86_07580 [Halobacteriales archaeon QS_3_64_16]|nr:MAG: hypothetical protein BRC86_07580 [Halobacteriales archaeon QS_3_64_16]
MRANRWLAPHTDLDTADARVAGTNFQDFLESSAEYRFVEWLLGALLFEIRATGDVTALGALEEAIPTIDQADLQGTIDVEYVTDSETRRDTERFDVVFRDRMDDPLLVACLEESPSPVPVERVTDLLTAANRVDETTGTLASAFVISGGYFEPDSLETAAEVTDSGFLSRDSRKSFVDRSRRQGYHLCLVEALDGSFHLRSQNCSIRARSWRPSTRLPNLRRTAGCPSAAVALAAAAPQRSTVDTPGALDTLLGLDLGGVLDFHSL